MTKQKLWELIEAYRMSGGSEEHHARKEQLDAVLDGLLAQPEPPPECVTEAEKKAFAFGWFKAMEAQRIGKPA